MILAMLFLLLSPLATASDGVIEINQTCAVNTGCTNTDKPGFPITIESGSYLLTSDLDVPAEVNGISTESLNNPLTFPSEVLVMINLNGFEISSTTSCSGVPTSCAPTNNDIGAGIRIQADVRASGYIHNGAIRRMASYGIRCKGDCMVQDLSLSDIGVSGIYMPGPGSGNIRDVQIYRCGSSGINMEVTGSISHSNVSLCALSGISSAEATVENNTASSNGGDGFRGRGTFRGNVAVSNLGFGIFGQPGAVIIENLLRSNRNGIRCWECLARDNSINATETGIDLENTGSVYGGNIIEAGTQDLLDAGNAIQDGVNLCSGTPCPPPS